MYSTEQLKNWERYERIRQSGVFNMFDPRARDCTTMSVSEWVFCIEHYEGLRDAHAHEEQANA
jgi:hypothetical protein